MNVRSLHLRRSLPLFLLGLSIAGLAGCDEAEPFLPVGNVDPAVLPAHGSVGFLIVDGEYQLFRMPGMVDTSINYVSPDGRTAYGWSRDLRVDDPLARELPFVLDLRTNAFRSLEFPGVSWAVVRNGTAGGELVGKLALDAGTPDDSSDDLTRGFAYDLATEELTLFERPGYDDIGISGSNRRGVRVGFNDFGMQGFAIVDGAYLDLDHADAFRLFPMAIDDEGTIVGFWGDSAESWYENGRNPGFVARLRGTELEVERIAIPGYSGSAFTGIDRHGRLAGLAYRTPDSLPVVVRLEGPHAEPETFSIAGSVEPFPTGISDRGFVYGQLYILETPPICGGHGTLEGPACVCEQGYVVDPYDATNCVVPGAPCDGHGHLHGDDCHCDEGFEPDPADSMRCVPAG